MNKEEALDIIRTAQQLGRFQLGDVNLSEESLWQAVEFLVDATSYTYSGMSEKYSTLRADEPGEWDQPMIDRMLHEVRDRVDSRRLSVRKGKWTLLDMGTGHGRDLRFFASLEDVAPIGVENSPGFIRILQQHEKDGVIPRGCFARMDMRDLSGIEDRSVACVRDHATLHHLPMLWKGIGADQAVSEGARVLQVGGIYYTLVKRGRGFVSVDTGEGLGARVFQLYNVEQLRALLERNGFRVIYIEERIEHRGGSDIDWIFALSERSA